MCHFFSGYRGDPKLSALVRDLQWTNNLINLGQTKHSDEREFYLRVGATER